MDSDDEFQVNSPNTKRSISREKVSSVATNLETPCKRQKLDVTESFHNVQTQIHAEIVPSTSECRNKTPLKSCRNQVTVKSPENLLSLEALKLYRTPEKHAENFLVRLRSPTPKKLCFGVDKPSDHSLLSKIDEISNTRISSPKKTTPIKLSRRGEITPSKARTSKLFQKSPNDLETFKVHVIDDFVKITPSKSNSKSCDDVIFVRSSEKKQSSILSYMSPSASKG